MVDVNVKEIDNISPVTIASIDKLAPLEISNIDKIAPVAVHIKELNQVDPLLIESLRVDRVQHVDPLAVDRLNITRLPVVNLSVNQVPEISLGVSRIPPVALAVRQCFDFPSDYTARARFLGFEVMRIHIQGRTRLVPHDPARREQAHTHERSFPEVAAVGNPAIPSRLEERCGEAVPLPRPPPAAGGHASHASYPVPRALGPVQPEYRTREAAGMAGSGVSNVGAPTSAPLSVGPPRFAYLAGG
jgi:hypothetical protein